MYRLSVRDLIDHANKSVIVERLGRWSDPVRVDRSLAVERIGPSASKPLHFHVQSEEVFFVIAGSGAIVVDGVHHSLNEGDAVLVMPNERHALVTGPAENLRVLLISTPAYDPEDFFLC
jgi:mannose-6-phosphate isomerase-like protein (cupin superfamily)